MFSEMLSNALYSIICLNLVGNLFCFVLEDWRTLFFQDNFRKYVSDLLELPSNESKRRYLQDAFDGLFDGTLQNKNPNAFDARFNDTNFKASKEAKKHFQTRFQQFLVKTSGIFCLK